MQALLGHPCLPHPRRRQGKCRHVDTTLGYARLYDGTLAAHYYRAMGEVEGRLKSVKTPRDPPFVDGQLLAAVDQMCAGSSRLA